MEENYFFSKRKRKTYFSRGKHLEKHHLNAICLPFMKVYTSFVILFYRKPAAFDEKIY